MKPLYAQFDGDDVDGKIYALGDELVESADAGTRAYLEGTGRFAAFKPGDGALSTYDTARDVADMSRADLLNELADGQGDDVLRDAVQQKRDRLADAGTGTGTAGPLDGSAADAIAYVKTATDVDELTKLRAEEVAGSDRTTVIAAIDKRLGELQPAQ